jgi:hypothetical protein
MTVRIAVLLGVLCGGLPAGAESPLAERYETTSPDAFFDLRASLGPGFHPAMPPQIGAVAVFADGLEATVNGGWPADMGGPGAVRIRFAFDGSVVSAVRPTYDRPVPRGEGEFIAACNSDAFVFRLRPDGRMEADSRADGARLSLGSLPFVIPQVLTIVHLTCDGERFAAADARSGQVAFGGARVGVRAVFRPRHPIFEALALRASASAASVRADPAAHLISVAVGAAFEPDSEKLFVGLGHAKPMTEGFVVLSLAADGADERLHRLELPAPQGAELRQAWMVPQLFAAGGGRIAVADRRGWIAIYTPR